MGKGRLPGAVTATVVACIALLALVHASRPACAQASFDRPGGDYSSAPVTSGDPEDCAKDLQTAGYLMLATQHSLRSVVDRLLVGVQASARRLAEVFGPEVATRPGYRAALIEMTVFANAALGAYTVQQEIGREDRSRLRAVYGVYVLETRSVWAPRPGAEDCNGLADPPRDPADFVALGNCAARSIRITTLLGEK